MKRLRVEFTQLRQQFNGSALIQLQPRILRLRDAPGYLGMDRNRFNEEVRPDLTEIPIGKQGVGFDRLEVDAWIDDYIACNGRPSQKGNYVWDAKHQRASSSEAVSGISIRGSADAKFNAALERVSLLKRKKS